MYKQLTNIPIRAAICIATLLTVGFFASVLAQPTGGPLPRIVEKDGRYALFVDGAPYLMLGVQVNNSSAWPSMLPKVWPAVEAMQANTVEMPVYWEQMEPQQGKFDFTVVDELIRQSRQHRVRLVLLWFGTWKNGSGHYMPEWMKRSPELGTHIIGKDGRPLDSPSPYARAALAADIRAFSTLMSHLKQTDPQRTVIMVQVQNEPGTWGSVRDYSPVAQRLFESPVPQKLLVALKKNARPGANWQEVFGVDAEEFFHAWSVADYIGQVAAAGKAIYPLPLYTNAAVRDPLNPGRPPSYESGGPTDNVLLLWKAAAPALDLLAPDIYLPDSVRYLKVLELYARPDNALFVPESGNKPEFARYVFAAIGYGAIGFAPFGLDYTGYSNAPLGAVKITEELVAEFALNYKLLEPMSGEIARLNFEGKLKAVVEEKNKPSQSLEFGLWTAKVTYGLPQFGMYEKPPGNPEPTGRALIAKLSENEFLVAGFFCRVDFHPVAPDKQRQFMKVEEGLYKNGVFKPHRIWNGDQTDYGLNFTSEPQILRVRIGTY
jgi:beta-galactosidase GanA